MIYIVIYALSKVLTVITVDMMWHWVIQHSGWNRHKLSYIYVDCGNNMSIYQMTELAIMKLERFPKIIDFIQIIYMTANDKSVKLLPNFIIRLPIFSRLFAVWIKIFIIEKYYPTQLQPIRGYPFMVFPCVIPFYKIIPIKNSVRAQDDKSFRIQQIDRNSYKRLIENS